MRSWVSLVLGFLLILAAAGGAAAATNVVTLPGGDGEPPGADHWPSPEAPNDKARGLVFNGLFPGQGNGPCEGMFEISVPGSPPICTHGPDPAPPGVDVTVARDFSSEGAATAAEGTVPVIGDGESGNRVQVVYAVSTDKTNRADQIVPLIPGWAGEVDRVFAESAAQVGGQRHVRFVTNPDGTLNVAVAVLSPTGDDSIGNTISELKALGLNDPSRKYLVWMDANLYCGIAQIYSDDKPTQDNYNNGRFPMYARVDAGCWGRTYSVEAHELMHTLGGVQPSAPNASAAYHCTDENDRMCYKDGAGVTMQYVCPSGNEAYMDCNHDDYYHPSPPDGSYLASHWNTADSSFLEAGPGGDPPPNAAPFVDAGPNLSVTLPEAASLDGTVSDDGLPGGTLTTAWSTFSGPGVVTFGDPSSVDTTATFPAAGTYVLELLADDGELVSTDTVTVTVEDAPPPPSPPPVNEAPSVDAGPDLSVTLPDDAVLNGAVLDDGLPDGTLTTAWSKASGPGTVTFGNAAAVDTTASFSAPGEYVLELSAGDGELVSTDTVTVTVDEAAPPPGPTEVTDTFESSLNRKSPTRSFEVTVAEGSFTATLTVAAESARGKKAAPAPPELTLELFDATGKSLAVATGPSPVVLVGSLAAGTYTYVVSGSTKASFTLEVTHLE
ncbi:MAG: hypothetical protein R6W83_11770 [Cryobacterium sp.]